VSLLNVDGGASGVSIEVRSKGLEYKLLDVLCDWQRCSSGSLVHARHIETPCQERARTGRAAWDSGSTQSANNHKSWLATIAYRSNLAERELHMIESEHCVVCIIA